MNKINIHIKKKLLKNYLKEKYGKRQGKKLFKGFKKEIKILNKGNKND